MPLRPTALAPRPGILLAILGGLAGTLLLSALLFLAPALGFPYIDFPMLLGGVFTSSPAAAFWLGFVLFFVFGAFIFGPLISLLWSILPGRGLGLADALVKGLLWGLILWVLSGIAMPVLAALNRLGGAEHLRNPGFFAIATGWRGVVAVLGGHLAYGLAVALVATMGRGIHPLDTLGWPGHQKGTTPPSPGIAGGERLPDSPPVGSR